MINLSKSFMAHEHVNYIQDTIRFRAIYSMLREPGDNAGLTYADAWKDVDSQKHNARGDVFFIKHSAELKEN